MWVDFEKVGMWIISDCLRFLFIVSNQENTFSFNSCSHDAREKVLSLQLFLALTLTTHRSWGSLLTGWVWKTNLYGLNTIYTSDSLQCVNGACANSHVYLWRSERFVQAFVCHLFTQVHESATMKKLVLLLSHLPSVKWGHLLLAVDLSKTCSGL